MCNNEERTVEIKTEYIHTTCGKRCFWKVGKPWEIGDPIYARDVIYSDGRVPEELTIMVCEGCRQEIEAPRPKFLVPKGTLQELG